MTPSATNGVFGHRARVNTGSGHQFNIDVSGADPTVDWAVVMKGLLPKVDARHVAAERRQALRRRFVNPLNFGQAAEYLRAPGAVVLLSGADGSGRHAAATMLLDGLTSTLPADQAHGGRFEELPSDPSDGELTVGPHDRFLLDLSEHRQPDQPSAAEVFERFRTDVEANKARMVAVLPDRHDFRLPPETLFPAVRIEAPPGREVVLRGLRTHGVRIEPAQLDTPELARFVGAAPMRDLARFVELIRAARDGGVHGADFSDWAAQALNAAENGSAEVEQQLKECRAPAERALLLTTALLHGAPADAVYYGRNALMALIGRASEVPDGLEDPDLLTQLRALNITRGGDSRLSFARLSYDSAVRRHFWLHFPGLRPELRTWVDTTIRSRDLDVRDRTDLVRRFAEEALATDRSDDVWQLAEAWATDSPQKLGPFAVAALAAGLADARHAGRFHKSIYYTSTSSQPLSRGLIAVLTAVCRDTLYATHPDQALVRLHHLALRPGADLARDALLDLAGEDLRLRRQLVQRILRSSQRLVGNIGLFLSLVDAHGTPDDWPWPDWQTLWRRTLNSTEQRQWEPLVLRWLTMADRMPAPLGDQALRALAEAASEPGDLLNSLYSVAHTWAGANDSASGTACRLWRRIDQLQGLADDLYGMTGPSRPDHTGESS